MDVQRLNEKLWKYTFSLLKYGILKLCWNHFFFQWNSCEADGFDMDRKYRHPTSLISQIMKSQATKFSVVYSSRADIFQAQSNSLEWPNKGIRILRKWDRRRTKAAPLNTNICNYRVYDFCCCCLNNFSAVSSLLLVILAVFRAKFWHNIFTVDDV